MNKLCEMGFDVILQVHDSIVIDSPIESVPRTRAAMREVMSTMATEKFGIPLDIDIKISPHL